MHLKKLLEFSTALFDSKPRAAACAIKGMGMDILDQFYGFLPDDRIGLYNEMADKAMDLGFKPKLDKTKHLSVSFISSAYKITILRFIYEKNVPAYRLKFFASHDYSSVFDQSIKKTIEKYNFKYVGCYKCGKCKDELEGYRVEYEDGRGYFRCGFELIEIIDLNEQVKDEVVKLMERQAEYCVNKKAASAKVRFEPKDMR